MKKSIQQKRVITKILKSDENNQYGFGMTEPIPTCCIKQNLDTSWRNSNFFLQNRSLSDKFGRLFEVNFEFDHTKATEKQIAYNEIYPPIIEKQKVIDRCERLVYQ